MEAEKQNIELNEHCQKAKKEITKLLSSLLVGMQITKVDFLSEQECVDRGWSLSPLVLELEDGVKFILQKDEEGNNGGCTIIEFINKEMLTDELVVGTFPTKHLYPNTKPQNNGDSTN